MAKPFGRSRFPFGNQTVVGHGEVVTSSPMEAISDATFCPTWEPLLGENMTFGTSWLGGRRWLWVGRLKEPGRGGSCIFLMFFCFWVRFEAFLMPD